MTERISPDYVVVDNALIEAAHDAVAKYILAPDSLKAAAIGVAFAALKQDAQNFDEAADEWAKTCGYYRPVNI
jgi:hypothetical protein